MMSNQVVQNDPLHSYSTRLELKLHEYMTGTSFHVLKTELNVCFIDVPVLVLERRQM